jgi:hypothetical protein
MSTLEISRPGRVSAGGVRLARRAVAAAQALAEVGDGVADDRQRAILEAFSGWGSVAALFDAEPAGAWAKLADELDDAAGEAMAAAARVVDTSFFTPPALVGHIWAVLRAAGFTGGSVLDSSFMRNFCVSRDIEHRARSRSPRAIGAQSASQCRPRYSVASRYVLRAS